MKPLLLTVVLLGLVATSNAQDVLSDPLGEQDSPGTWYVKAIVASKELPEGKRPKAMFPVTVTALERGNFEINVTILKDGQCHEKKTVIEKTEEPGKFTSFQGQRTVFAEKLPELNHRMLYFEGECHGEMFRMAILTGRTPEENPEALEEFKKFVQHKGLPQEKIFKPEQRERCVPDSD